VDVKFTRFQDLEAFRTQLQERARAAEKQSALDQEIALAAYRERHFFSLNIGPVSAMRSSVRVNVSPPPPGPEPRQRLRDEQAALLETISDDFDVDSLLETDEGLSYRRPDIGHDVLRKLRRGAWTIQAQLDLHGLRRDEAREQLGIFLREVAKKGLRCVRIIHGKGYGSPGREPVLKAKVRSWLVQKQEILAFVQARASEGGHGALVVLLGPQ
jgi:DNA-nicking Smr family endonuclease